MVNPKEIPQKLKKEVCWSECISAKQQGDSATAQHQIAVQREPSGHNVIRTKARKHAAAIVNFLSWKIREMLFTPTPQRSRLAITAGSLVSHRETFPRPIVLIRRTSM